jgi:DNA-binding NtrC family response regulator
VTAKAKPTVLIVDDEKNIRDGLLQALEDDWYVGLAENGARALKWLETHRADAVLTDLRMPGMDGMELLARLLKLDNPPVVIMLTAYGNVETAVEAMKRGAYDFLTKPVNLDRLDLVLRRALRERQRERENTQLKAQLDRKYGFETILGNSPAMQEVFDVIRQAAPTRATVLIQGESGTGKELVARALHQNSPRRDAPFVPVHCAALAPTLLESELFGHEKGAFTGATERRAGRFEKADGGTLFLDEVGEIDPALQVKILRVLQERQFERVGGTDTLSVDVRLVAATNRDLQSMVAAGTFREDLYYRLNVINVTLPPLRERGEGDIALLARHYLDELSREHGRPPSTLTPAAMDVLAAYPWPGNVRQLRNVIERLVVLGHGGPIDADSLPRALRDGAAAPSPAATADIPPPSAPPPDDLRAAERRHIESALLRCHGNRTRAAEALGISRRTLHRKLNEYGLRTPPSPGNS